MTDTKKYNYYIEEINTIQKQAGIKKEITYYITLELLFYKAITNKENKYYIKPQETIYNEKENKFYLNTLNKNFNKIKEKNTLYNDLYLIENYNIYNQNRLNSLNMLYKEIYKIIKNLNTQEQRELFKKIIHLTHNNPKLRNTHDNIKLFNKFQHKLLKKYSQKKKIDILDYNITSKSLSFNLLQQQPKIKLHAYVNDIIEYSLIIMLLTISNTNPDNYKIILKNKLFTDNENTKYDIILQIPDNNYNNWINNLKKDLEKNSNKPTINLNDYKTIQQYLKNEGILIFLTRENDLYTNNLEKTRQNLTTNHNITTIISLPKELNKLFGPSEYVILISDTNRKENIYFININYQPKENDLNKFLEIYENPQEIKDIAHLATIPEIKENNYNLNFTRYINIYHKNNIELNNIINNIHELEKENIEKNKEIKNSCEKLGIYL